MSSRQVLQGNSDPLVLCLYVIGKVLNAAYQNRIEWIVWIAEACSPQDSPGPGPGRARPVPDSLARIFFGCRKTCMASMHDQPATNSYRLLSYLLRIYSGWHPDIAWTASSSRVVAASVRLAKLLPFCWNFGADDWFLILSIVYWEWEAIPVDLFNFKTKTSKLFVSDLVHVMHSRHGRSLY